MPSCSVAGLVRVNSAKTILVPPGDQPGPNARERLLVASGIFARPVPSGWTTYSEPLLSNRIQFPFGDQLPSASEPEPQGVIRCRPVPLRFTTNSAWAALAGRAGSVRPKTICVPAGE